MLKTADEKYKEDRKNYMDQEAEVEKERTRMDTEQLMETLAEKLKQQAEAARADSSQ